MLKNTFIHIPGLGSKREKDLWAKGVMTWDDLAALPNPRLDPNWRADSLKAWDAQDMDHFATKLPPKEHWRLAASFPAETIFVDIETTGFSADYDHITIIGWSLGGTFKVMVNGRDNPNSFLRDLAKSKAMVTFNGRCFDAKFLIRLFGANVLPTAHADLRFLCRVLGWSGGQKNIEAELGLTRQTHVQDGEEAVFLWNQYVHGRNPAQKKQALRDLIIYNHADIEGMKVIFDACLDRLAEAGLPNQTGLFAALAATPDFSDPDRFPFSLDLLKK
ncbi:MAG: ribonuclease H-like domain-containing protein [Deltaproteobacteria bacterium]|jgi:uncharacterized protein YprB with RNaseH-like and TPR domain|nr:ribonuclease H-like domain-containing protein [Deltaproteobacteria bacterium]